MLDALVIAPHPDDAEIGTAGSIAVLRAAGFAVGILDLTNGEPTPHGSPERRAIEAADAGRVLDVTWRKCLGLPNRSLEHTLDARRALAAVIRVERPRILFAPYWQDAHPDHVAASSLADAARFWAKLTRTDLPGSPHWCPQVYYYFSIHLRIVEQPSFVIDVTPHIETKMRAIACFESQVSAQRRGETWPTTLDNIRDRARFWGWAIGAGYGEPFLSREPIGLGGFPGLSHPPADPVRQ